MYHRRSCSGHCVLTFCTWRPSMSLHNMQACKEYGTLWHHYYWHPIDRDTYKTVVNCQSYESQGRRSRVVKQIQLFTGAGLLRFPARDSLGQFLKKSDNQHFIVLTYGCRKLKRVILFTTVTYKCPLTFFLNNLFSVRYEEILTNR